ncbi:RNI-like protein [Gonapodya prolifera JEL478]|uniref:RNI-like protein n=1 Tax=Gonapodya prolifera (strain JEL478) TaxID=1344416 RepID=A0A139AKH5_GONPJ|nr:RNI-like protein [Gonapodya prolifera JEL478]|eukprot:KXS17044.1 RNI-like protein [Gonapodya prolifera JEL478]
MPPLLVLPTEILRRILGNLDPSISTDRRALLACLLVSLPWSVQANICLLSKIHLNTQADAMKLCAMLQSDEPADGDPGDGTEEHSMNKTNPHSPDQPFFSRFSDGKPGVYILSLCFPRKVTMDMRTQSFYFPREREMTVDDAPLVQLLRLAPRLRHLDLGTQTLSEAIVTALQSNCPHLQSLDLSTASLSDYSTLSSLFSQTRPPCIGPCNITPIGARIKSLDLGKKSFLLPSVLVELARNISGLRHFSTQLNDLCHVSILQSDHPRTPDDATALCSFFKLVRSRLRTLNVRCSLFMVHEVVLAAVEHCAISLTKLDFGGSSPESDPAYPAYHNRDSLKPTLGWMSLLALAGFTNLTHLRLPGLRTLYDGALIRMAESMPGLMALDVAGCRELTDKFLKSLAEHCTQIRWLDVAGCEFIGDMSLIALGSEGAAKYLTALDIGGTEVSDERLGWLAARRTFLIYIGMRGIDMVPRDAAVGIGEVGEDFEKGFWTCVREAGREQRLAVRERLVWNRDWELVART